MSCCPIACAAASQVSSLRFDTGTDRVLQHRGNYCRIGHDLAQQLESLCRQRAVEKTHARNIATRSAEACDEAIRDRIVPASKDDWHRRGCCLGSEHRRGIADDQGYLPPNQITNQNRQPIALIFRRTVFDCDVLAFDEACFLQALAERTTRCAASASEVLRRNPITGIAGCCARAASGHACRAAEQRDELAPA